MFGCLYVVYHIYEKVSRTSERGGDGRNRGRREEIEREEGERRIALPGPAAWGRRGEAAPPPPSGKKP